MKDLIKMVIVIIIIFVLLGVLVLLRALDIPKDASVVIDDETPSEISENEDETQTPVQPEDDTEGQQQTVELYYYNPDLDMDESGNIMCSEEGLVMVEREIPLTQTPIQDVVRLLLKGELTDEEVEEGLTTEYPLSGFSLQGVTLTDGVLTLGFNDPNNQTVGGSCRAGILWSQISRTASQFDVVEEVRFEPEELFQP